MRYQGYLNRALKSSDPRYLQIFTRMGYGAPSAPYVPAPLPDPPPVIEPPIEDDDDDDDEGGPPEGHGTPDEHAQQLRVAREEYERVTGKRPFNGWDVAELHKRIADYKKANQGS